MVAASAVRRDGRRGVQKGQAMSKAKLGNRYHTLGSASLGEMRDSSALSRRLVTSPRNRHRSRWRSRLRARLAADGYLFLRGLLPADAVQAAQQSLLSQMQTLGLAENSSGKAAPNNLPGSPSLGSSEVLAVLNHPALFRFLDLFFGEMTSVVFDANLRAVRPGQRTGFHTDSVYMGKLNDETLPPVVACWIPVTHIDLSLGGLVLCRGSNSHPGFEQFRQTYGKLDLDEADIGGTGWFTEDPDEVLAFGGRFETAAFAQGDVVLFTMHTVHGSTSNCTDRWRLSLDFRVTPGPTAEVAPSVPNAKQGRWSRLRHNLEEFPRTMEQAKIDWGLSKVPARNESKGLVEKDEPSCWEMQGDVRP
eukprot:symbB.v1.2.006975.t1/scaffold424.1/size207036/3